jgi:hypothetical protein
MNKLIISLILGGFLLVCTSCSKQKYNSQTYIAYSTNSQDLLDFSRNAHHDFAKNTTISQYLNLDILDGNATKNVYSKGANRNELHRIDARLNKITASNDIALIASVKRILEIAKSNNSKNKLNAYIITYGTSDPKILADILIICNQIKQLNPSNLKVYLLGLSPTNKILTSSAFNPIANQMGGSCINDYSQCRSFIDRVGQELNANNDSLPKQP